MTQYNAPNRSSEQDGSDLTEKVVKIRRVAKVVKGGRNLSFNAMVVVGDGRGTVGIGMGKGVAVPDAVRKGTSIAKKDFFTIPLRGTTIPHQVIAKFGASRVIMKPASPGAGVIAGGAVRAVMEAVGIKDVVAKALGSRNPINLVKATIVGLQSLKGEPSVEQLAPAVRAVHAPRPQRSSDPRAPRPRRESRSATQEAEAAEVAAAGDSEESETPVETAVAARAPETLEQGTSDAGQVAESTNEEPIAESGESPVAESAEDSPVVEKASPEAAAGESHPGEEENSVVAEEPDDGKAES